MPEYHHRDLRSDISPVLSPEVNGSEKILIPIQDLINRIEEEIIHCKKQKEKYTKMRHYSDKISVLNATKNYACGNITLHILEEYMRIYSKWDKESELCNTTELVTEVIV